MIQAKDLYMKKRKFKCIANIVMNFNEVTCNDDASDWLARRFELADFFKKYVDKRNLGNDKKMQVMKGLSLTFETKAYGCAFLAYLMIVYTVNGFNIEVPEKFQEASKKNIEDIMTFDQSREDTFMLTNNEAHVVTLKKIFEHYIQ